MEYTCLDLEAKSKQQNVIIHGLEEVHDEEIMDISRKFLMDLGMSDTVIHRAFRLGRPRVPQTSIRPVMISLTNVVDVDTAIKKGKELLAESNIRVTRDNPAEIRKARGKLAKELREYRNAGKEAYIAFPARLVVEGRTKKDLFPNWYKVLSGQKLGYQTNIQNQNKMPSTNHSHDDGDSETED